MSSKAIFLFLFMIGVLLLNWPLLAIFKMSLPFYMFGVWAVFIAIIGIFITLGRRQRGNGDDI